MKLVRSMALSTALVMAAVAGAACGGSVENPQTSATATTKAPIGAGTHGMVKTIGDALGEVPLRTEQRTELEKLAQAAEARHAPMATGRKELFLTLADQIEKGAIDRAALDPKIERVAADAEKARTEDRAALTRLHAVLDAEQRGVFVDALEKQFKAKHGAHSMKDGMKGFAHLKQLADDLKLTDEQKSQIHDALRDLHKEQAASHHGAVHGWHRGEARAPHGGKHGLEAFREDAWTADAMVRLDVKKATAEGTTRFVGATEKILPILTPEQRKIAADKLRERANTGGDLPLAH
jgi:Spy/CpxP family protein refolding chaperone